MVRKRRHTPREINTGRRPRLLREERRGTRRQIVCRAVALSIAIYR
jgi:hypothetical protein